MFRELMIKDSAKIEHAKSYLSQKTVFTEYGALGRSIALGINTLLGKPRLERKLKLFNTPEKKNHLIRIIRYVGGKVGEDDKHLSAKELLNKLPKNLRAKVVAYILSNVQGNERAIVDTNMFTIITEHGSKEVEGKTPAERYKMLSDIARKYNIKLKPYAEAENEKLLVKALMLARSKDEVPRIYDQLVREKIASDPLFAKEYPFIIEKELRKFYTAGMITSTFAYMMERIPQLIVTAIARSVARISSMIPIIGSIATVNGEIGIAIGEIGYAVGDRVRAMSYMWYHVPRQQSKNKDMERLINEYRIAKQEAENSKRLLERATRKLEEVTVKMEEVTVKLEDLEKRLKEIEEKLEKGEKKVKKEKKDKQRRDGQEVKGTGNGHVGDQKDEGENSGGTVTIEEKEKQSNEYIVQEEDNIEEKIEKQHITQIQQELLDQQKQGL